jgi:hypothetical protein
VNILLWVFQILLALHTAIGAVWKFSHDPVQTMPTLKAIPSGVWQAMSVLEILCALGLVLPALNKSLGILTPIAAVIIAAEMLFFCGVHLSYGDGNYGPMMYWLVVAIICAFIAYGRFVLKPF